MELFKQMQSSEQAHSLWIFRQLRQQLSGVDLDAQHDLLVAALLHDVGKSRHPLQLWERVVIVLGKALFPNLVQQWGTQPPDGWKRPFVIAAQHPAWGAEIAAQAGASPLVVALVRRHHQDKLDKTAAVEAPALEDQNEQVLFKLLRLLQRYDEER
jgi:putative nucleotidyltransferase with HDIG domain